MNNPNFSVVGAIFWVIAALLLVAPLVRGLVGGEFDLANATMFLDYSWRAAVLAAGIDIRERLLVK